MTLSVCLLTNDPGARVAATLALLRPVADEIVIAADARAEPDDLAHYAAAADRLLRVEADFFETVQAWLHAQCSSDWILRIDGDEVPSAPLVARLPELMADRRAIQYLFPRRWLYEDRGRWLSGIPWWPDYQMRLVRNDGMLRFSGVQHGPPVPVRPIVYTEEPIYHLDLLVNSLRRRREKALAYQSRGAPLEAPGGGEINHRFYVPEDGPDAPTAAVPAADLELIARVLDASAPAGAPPDPLPPVTGLEQARRHLPTRTLPADAYAASVASIEGPVRMRAGERRPLHIRFTNEGSDRWPWDPELGPPIVASYRLRDRHGEVVVQDGPRTAFPCTVGPGESTVVPLDLVAPAAPGRYTVEPDVVHEGVRWFGSGARVDLEVQPTDRGGQAPVANAGLGLPLGLDRVRAWLALRTRRAS